ncbi:MAG TPA: hypothetical protein VNF46_03785 [Gammaproteobacteria bacterium]|nr:hypothetical protein [Gammaproteobacteria bacterium]
MTCTCGSFTTPRRARCGRDWIDYQRCQICGCVDFIEARVDEVTYTGDQARTAWQTLLASDGKLDEVL